MANVSYIINTCLGDPWLVQQTSPVGRLYGSRRAAIEESLKRVCGIHWEIIVVGQLPQELVEDKFLYVHHPPVERSRMDALFYRELGARHSTGDILVFSHDDHVPSKSFVMDLNFRAKDFDILVPLRKTRNGTVLNNGSEDNYMGGHVLAMTRNVWAEVPWTSVQTEWWDLPMTRIWREKGFSIDFDDTLVVEDWEQDSSPESFDGNTTVQV